MQKTYNLLSEHIDHERKNIRETKINNIYGLIFGDLLQYYEYLSLILNRLNQTGNKHIQVLDESFPNIPGGGAGHMNGEDFERLRLSGVHIRLELETLFLFTNVFLDRVAAAHGFYYGANPDQCKSFLAMHHIKKFSAEKKLNDVSDELCSEIEWLLQHVCKFRHEAIAHKHEDETRRLYIFGTGFNPGDKEAYLNISVLYPEEGKQSDLEPIKSSELIQHLNTFIAEWVGYLKANPAVLKNES